MNKMYYVLKNERNPWSIHEMNWLVVRRANLVNGNIVASFETREEARKNAKKRNADAETAQQAQQTELSLAANSVSPGVLALLVAEALGLVPLLEGTMEFYREQARVTNKPVILDGQ